MSKLNTFKGYTIIALASNILFVLFIIVTMVYYAYYLKTGNIVRVVEFIAYTMEVGGFILMLASIMGYISKLRGRLLLKIGMSVYFVVEFIIMILDFNVIDAKDFYSPTSKILIISHCVFSAAVALLYMGLEKNRLCLQISVAVTAVIMMLGVFSIVYNVRVYASVLINCIAYIIMYSLILTFHGRQLLEVDCYGDSEKLYDDSGFFIDDHK